MLSFITGSRAYGRPTDGSDVDLVIRVTPATAELLRELAGGKEPVRFGKLNLILCTTDEEFAVWRIGTTEMNQSPMRPYTREAAKRVFDEYRLRLGLLDLAQSGGTEGDDAEAD